MAKNTAAIIAHAARLRSTASGVLCVIMLLQAASAAQPIDPGPRPGPAAAGGPLPGLHPLQLKYFTAAQAQFSTIDSVSGTLPGESGGGLGPRFNGNFCAACHAYPAVGGASPPLNPQISLAARDGASNKIPPFLQAAGPVREARFIAKPDGQADGSVHQLFTIAGRSDAPGCLLSQPDFAREAARGNIALRIPTSLFGLGLVENVADQSLIEAQNAHAGTQQSFGIAGHFNHDANDGAISRFGWKAQDKSLLIFAGEAYNVEQGVSNELFPSELAGNAKCQFNPTPEDAVFFQNTIHSGSPSSDFSSGTENFALFARLLAPPQPASLNESAQRGAYYFNQTGCEACHFENLKTAPSIYPGQSNKLIHPYSDFALHRMGSALADYITQGEAAGDEFRTAPLWGIGQRLFFLHDGRTTSLLEAILAHRSPGSEANQVITRFQSLPPESRQDILNFLRSL